MHFLFFFSFWTLIKICKWSTEATSKTHIFFVMRKSVLSNSIGSFALQCKNSDRKGSQNYKIHITTHCLDAKYQKYSYIAKVNWILTLYHHIFPDETYLSVTCSSNICIIIQSSLLFITICNATQNWLCVWKNNTLCLLKIKIPTGHICSKENVINKKMY